MPPIYIYKEKILFALIFFKKAENKFMKKNFFVLPVLILILSGCVTGISWKTQKEEIPEKIMGTGLKTRNELVSFFMDNNSKADREKVSRLAGYYINKCAKEGVNHDVAFVQMCLETGFLRFGGLVTESMNNFCGLGAIDENQRGCVFSSESEGVLAHVQHLKAYGSKETLNTKCVDPRYKYVTPKGKSPYISGLAGTWAADKEYGTKLNGLLEKLYTF